MKLSNVAVLTAGIAIGAGGYAQLSTVQALPAGKFEYATVRWDGMDHSLIVRPGGNVQFLSPDIEKLPIPKGAHERAVVLNYGLTLLDKEGFEFAGMSDDDIIMRRPAR
jgi:hypothetical protein